MEGVAGVLFAGENVVYASRKHWVVFIKAAILWALALGAFSGHEWALKYLHFPVPEDFRLIVDKIVYYLVQAIRLGLTGVFAYMALGRLFTFFTTRLAVTGKRLIVYDRLSGSLSSFDIGRIESVEAGQGLFGGILGYGSVVVTTGSGRKTKIVDMARPHDFEKALFAAK